MKLDSLFSLGMICRVEDLYMYDMTPVESMCMCICRLLVFPF